MSSTTIISASIAALLTLAAGVTFDYYRISSENQFSESVEQASEIEIASELNTVIEHGKNTSCEPPISKEHFSSELMLRANDDQYELSFCKASNLKLHPLLTISDTEKLREMEGKKDFEPILTPAVIGNQVFTYFKGRSDAILLATNTFAPIGEREVSFIKVKKISHGN